MRVLNSFVNLVAISALIYLLFELVPSLLSEDNTAYVIGGIVLIVSVIAVILPQIIDIYVKIKGKDNAQ